MSVNPSTYPPPPYYWKKDLAIPPTPPSTGLYSMFGRMHTVPFTQLKEAPLAIEATGIPQRYDDQMLLEAHHYRSELKKMQHALASVACRLLESLALQPMAVEAVYAEYETVLVNFHQLLYKLRPAQAYQQVISDLHADIEKRKALTAKLVQTVERISQVVEERTAE